MRELSENKQQQRRQGIAGRESLSEEERAAFSLLLCQRIAQTGVFQRAETLLTYVPMRREADVSMLLPFAADKRVFFPFCPQKGVLSVLCPRPGAPWGKDIYGMRAPLPEYSEQLSPGKLDLVIVPCAAFDAERRRIGMGAGVYDRFLKKCPNAYKLGAAFSIQRVEHAAFDPAWDVPLDCVATEEGIWI